MLADFHACGWGQPAIPWMPGFDAAGVGGLQPMWVTNLPAFIDRYGDLLPEQACEWVLAFAPQLSEWSQRAAKEPLTVVHADYRLDNLIFGNNLAYLDPGDDRIQQALSSMVERVYAAGLDRDAGRLIQGN